MLGRLTIDALPLYSAIAFGGALVTVGGALVVVAAITWFGLWRYLWNEWLTSVDHKRIGIMYVTLAMIMLMRGFVDAMMMRSQQAIALNSDGYLPPEHFDQIFSSHGTIMIFFMAMPFLTGLINIVVPQQIGARDVAFPFMNAVSLWLTTAGAGLVMVSLVIGKFSTAGWTGYPPFSGSEFSPGVGVDYWLWAILIGGIGSTLTGINFIVTIFKQRAPGMTFMRMPLFTWTALCTSVLMTFAFPALTVVCAMLVLDRTLGMHFFTNGGGGNMMNYPNLFWLWGHPEVYILILPAFGVYSEVVATFCGKRLFGYTSLVIATASIAILSFTVWLHHFFTMGASANVNAFFGLATMIIAVPTGVKVFDWLLTMFRGRIIFHTSMLWTLGFIVTFVIGGMTGVLLALPPADYLMHNTTFLVAHFHNMLIPGALFGYFAGYHVLVPQGVRLHAQRAVGRARILVLADRLLPGLHAAVRAGFHGHAAAARALQHRRLAALPGRGRAGRPADPDRHRLSGGPVHRQRPGAPAGARSQRRSMERAHAGMADLLAARAVQFCGAARGAGYRRLPRHEGARRRLSQARALSRHHHAQQHQRRPHAGGPGRPARFRHDLVHLVDGDRIRALHVGRDHRARLR